MAQWGMAEKYRGYAHRIDIECDLSRVWRSLVDPAILVRWCSPGAQIRPEPGGVFRACVDRVTELEAHIDVFQPARRMRLIYMPCRTLPPSDSVIVDDFILEADPCGTIVRLLGSGYPAIPEWDVPYLRLRTAWQQALTRLKVCAQPAAERLQRGEP